MNALCLGLAGSVWATLPLPAFTLAWTHTIEKIRWEEDYRLSEAGLVLEAARVKGSGAGMEIPPGARLHAGAWHYRPQRVPLQPLRLARTPEAGDYTLCHAGQCRPFSDWLGPPDAQMPAVDLWVCTAASADHRAAPPAAAGAATVPETLQGALP